MLVRWKRKVEGSEYLNSKRLDALGIQGTCGEAKVCQFDMADSVYKEILKTVYERNTTVAC